MKLRSAQFVLLVLLFSSLGLSEGSSLRLADEFIASGAGVLLSPRAAARAAARSTIALRATTPLVAPAIVQAVPAGQREALARTWTMPYPAAQAASLQAANARA